MSGTTWEGKPAEEIVGAMSVYKGKLESSINSEIARIQVLADGANVSSQERELMYKKIRDVREEGQKRIDIMTKSKDNYLSTIEFFKRTSKDDMLTLDAQAKVFDQMIGWGFTPSEIKRMKTDEGRKQIYDQYKSDPNNPLVLGARQYETLRNAIAGKDFTSYAGAQADSTRLARINSIANALKNGQTVVEGKPIDKTDPDTIAGVKKVEGEAKEVLVKQATDVSREDINTLRANTVDMSDSKETVDLYHAFIKGGKIEGIDKESADIIRANTAARMNQWLSGTGNEHYPARTKALMQKNLLEVDGNGVISINRVDKGMWQVAGDAARTVAHVNKMIDLQAAASGGDRKAIAEKFVTTVNKLPVYDRSMSAQYGRANASLVKDVGAYLRTVPGYAKLDDATRTIVEEALGGFPTFKHEGLMGGEKESRANNFLNLRDKGKDSFRSFATKEAAVSAYNSQIDRYIEGKTDGIKRTTVGQIIGKWNNEKESGSMSKAGYLKVLKNKANLDEDTLIDTPEKKAKLLWGMQMAEVGAERMSLEEILQAIK
jgi:hypothetical protein